MTEPTAEDVEAAHAMVLIASGDFARGFPALDRCNDRRRAARKLPALQHAPKWRGGDLVGKTILIVTHTSGHGDAWQLLRFFPELKRRGARVVVCCPDGQARLLAEADGCDAVISASIEEPCGAWGLPWQAWDHDYHLPIDSLPGLLGVTLDLPPWAD
jgi:hypothetical protein